MLIQLQKQDGNFHFVASNESNKKIDIDASPAIGGEDKGVRPMEMLIMGLGGCSGIDVINILKKQKIELKKLNINIDAQREADAIPSLFNKIHLDFIFDKEVDQNKAQRAVDLSMEKYCSVAKTLEKTAKIDYKLIFE
jgi:putative redox protein